MYKILIKFGFILLLLIGLNGILDLFVSDFYGNESLFNKYGHAKAVDADVYLIGSSRSYRHLDPELLNSQLKDSGKTFYNLGTSGCFIPEIFFICNTIFPELAHKNKTVVLELSYYRSVKNTNSGTTRSNYHWNFNSMYNYINFCLRKKRYQDSWTAFQLWTSNQIGINSIKKKIQSLNKHYSINKIGIDGFRFLREKSIKYRDEKDLESLVKTVEVLKKNAGLYNDIAELDHVDSRILSEYQKLYKSANDYGITLFAYLPPLTSYTKELCAVFNLLDYDGKINLSDPELYPAHYEIENIYDHGHLNFKGAAKLTKEFGKLINPML